MKKFLVIILVSFLFISCEKSVEELKEKGDRIFIQASDLYERGYYSQASRLFEELISIDTRLTNYSRRANVYVYLGLIHFNRANYLKAKTYYENAQKDFKKVLDKKGEILALNNLAGVYSTLGEFDEAERIYQQIIAQSLLSADKEAEAISYLNLATLYGENYDFEKSFENLEKAYKAYEILGDIKGKLFTLNKLGESYLQVNNYVNALQIFDMAVELQNKTGQRYLYQEIYNNIGLIFFRQNQISKALDFFNLALGFEDKLESSQYILIILNNNAGDCHFKFESYSNAIKYYTKSLEISEVTIFKHLSPIFQTKIADAYLKLYKIDKNKEYLFRAEKYYEFALNRFKEIEDYENLRKVYTKLISFYSFKGEQKRIKELIDELLECKESFSIFKPYWQKDLALNLEDDYNFIFSLINIQNVSNAYKIYYKQKIFELLKYYLRFNDFQFLDPNQREKLKNLKTNLYRFSSYSNILIQDLALPKQQRDNEKTKFLKNSCAILEKEINKSIEELSKINKKFLPLTENFDFQKLLTRSDQLFIEYLLTENHLYIFFINKSQIKAKSIDLASNNLLFDLKVLHDNLENFSIEDLKKFTGENLQILIQPVIDEIESSSKEIRKVVFLLGEQVSDFVPHLIYVSNKKKFFSEIFSCSYSYLISEDKTVKDQGEVAFLIPSNSKLDVNWIKTFKIKIYDEQDFAKNLYKPFAKLFITFSLALNDINPSLSYFFDEFAEKSSRISLSDVFNPDANLFYFNNVLFNDDIALIKFLSTMQIANNGDIILPYRKISKEISRSFLYNYLERVRESSNYKSFEIVVRELLEKEKKKPQDILYMIYFEN